MAEIKFLIDNDNLPRIVNALKTMYPIPMINTGTEEEPVMENQFTDNEWAKESVRRLIVQTVRRAESKAAQDLAKTGVELDDTLIA